MSFQAILAPGFGVAVSYTACLHPPWVSSLLLSSSFRKLYPLDSAPRQHFWRFRRLWVIWEPPGVLPGTAGATKVWASSGPVAEPLPSRVRLRAAAPPPPPGAARKRGYSSAGRGKGRGAAVPGPPGSRGWTLRGQPAAPPRFAPPAAGELGAPGVEAALSHGRRRRGRI